MREVHLTSTQGFGTNRICKQRMLRRVCENSTFPTGILIVWQRMKAQNKKNIYIHV